MVIAELKRLDEVSYSGDMKGATQKGNMTLKFKDKQTNGLKQLIETGQRIYEMAQNGALEADLEAPILNEEIGEEPNDGVPTEIIR